MRTLLILLLAGSSAAAQATDTARLRAVRTELEKAYDENKAAYGRGDVAGVMALRAPDFHTIDADGTRRDRAEMQGYVSRFMNGVKQWNAQTLTIDSLELHGDTAIVIMSQHIDRLALRPDSTVHRVETWATQREAWVRHGQRWLMWRVDQVRNQRRLVDGQPQ
jgi:ketosteroid isomerase-like protein